MVPCEYCTDEAIGLDEDGEKTCGNSTTCTESIRPLDVSAYEVSNDDDDDE